VAGRCSGLRSVIIDVPPSYKGQRGAWALIPRHSCALRRAAPLLHLAEESSPSFMIRRDSHTIAGAIQLGPRKITSEQTDFIANFMDRAKTA